ncbi:MAG: prepilin peptidase [Lachnospiraceae bacterium]|nr:prepilin peptidase [Lachnospiraceae bacterium]
MGTVFVLLVFAVWMDLNSFRISNRLILLGLLLGLSLRIALEGWFGIVIFLGHILLPVLLLYLLYRIGALGAGDIKLISMMSGFLHLSDTAEIVLYSFFIGALIGVPKLLAEGRGSRIHFSVAVFLAYSYQMGVVA